MGMNDFVHPDFRHKETSIITDPSVNFDYAVQPYNVFAMNTVPNASNQVIRTINNGSDRPYEDYVLQSEMAKHYAADISRAQRENNQETYCEVGWSLAKARKDYLGNVTYTQLTNNSFDIIERIRICGVEIVLVKFKKTSQIISPTNDCETWFSVEEFMSDHNTENFLVEHLQIVSTKAFQKDAIKSIRNIVYCKLMSAPLKDYAQFGWNNANNENFYFDGLDIANTRGFPKYWISHKSKNQMVLSSAVRCLQKALESNPYLQNELSCAMLVSMVSIVLSFVRAIGDKAPVVVLHSGSAKAFKNIEAIFKYNENIPSMNNENICSKSSLQVKFLADDALIVDMVSHKNNSKIIQLSQGCFWGVTELKTPVYLVKHDFEDVLFSYDWAVDFDDFVIDAALGIAMRRLKYELITLIEEKKVAVRELRPDRGDVYPLCKTFLNWIGNGNVYGEYTKPILDILTRGLKALADFDGDNLITDILRQKIRLFVKMADKDSCIEKEQAYYIPTALFDELCEKLSLKPLTAKKALRESGGLRVYDSNRTEYTVDVTNPVSGKRIKAVAILKSFVQGR